MALALRISASSFASKWQPLGLGFASPRHSGSVNLRLVNLRRTRGWSLRCSNSGDADKVAEKTENVGAQSSGGDPEETVENVVVQKNVAGSNSAVVLHSSSWDDEEPSTDGFSGWTPFFADKNPNKLAGLLKIGAGIALVVAFSFVGYKALSRKGTGNLKEVLFSTKTHLLQLGGKISGSDANESLDSHESLGSKSATTPSSSESKQDVKGKNPESGLHQKEAASAAQATSWSTAVSATVDEEQEQALTALQALKVIDPGVESGGICTRREYARWLIAITGALARSSSQKVFPAMYIETVSELAFDDVVPEDPDFPYIQGLAEAGLIASNLSRHDASKNGRSSDGGAIFLPDSPLSRQDLISWKVALEGHNVETADVKKVKAESVYIDMDRIDEEALPFLAIDLAAGERSTIATVFGYTKRLQPGKPVTRAQAAMALITGDAADVVAEELTRLEADGMADAAVVAELALESRAQKKVDEFFNNELKTLEKRFEEVQNELERVVKEKDNVQAVVKVERDMLHKFREEVEEQLRTLTAEKIEVGIEKDRLEVLRKKAEYGGQDLAFVKVEVEVEKKALILARLWAEDEAKKARAHAKVLEEARKRWEGRGIEVRVDKDLQDDNIPALGWKYGGRKTNLNKFLQRPPVQDILDRAGVLKDRLVRRFLELLEALQRTISRLWNRAAEQLHGAGERASESIQVAGEKASNSLRVVRDKTLSSLRVAGDKAHTFQQDTFSVASKKAREAQDATRSTVVGLSSSVTEGTRKVADGFRGEAQKLAGKFKSS